MSFLPITKEEMTARGWEAADFVYVTGDAYVDHPSFGPAIITRLLESQGYRVAVLAQPRFDTPEDMTRFGRPRLGFLVYGYRRKPENLFPCKYFDWLVFRLYRHSVFRHTIFLPSSM